MGGIHAGETTIDEFRETKAQTPNNAGTVQAQEELNALFYHDRKNLFSLTLFDHAPESQ
jgi:hypothetical protein